MQIFDVASLNNEVSFGRGRGRGVRLIRGVAWRVTQNLKNIFNIFLLEHLISETIPTSSDISNQNTWNCCEIFRFFVYVKFLEFEIFWNFAKFVNMLWNFEKRFGAATKCDLRAKHTHGIFLSFGLSSIWTVFDRSGIRFSSGDSTLVWIFI